MGSYLEQLIFCCNYMVYFICLSPTIVAYSTISTCYRTAFDFNRYPKWVITPWISFTGVYEPEANVYAIGLTFAGVCLLVVNYIFTNKLMNNKRIIKWHQLNYDYMDALISFILSYNLIIASIAVTIQAWINVPDQMVLDFLSPKIQTMKWFDTLSAFIHIQTAGIFFFGCILWHNIAVILTFNHRETNELKYSFYYKIFHVALQCFGGTVLFINLTAASYIIDPYEQTLIFQISVNLIGLCQYIVTASYCLFWISYAYDYYIANKLDVENKKK